MSYLFFKCFSLISFPDITKWNTSNFVNINSIFCECNSLMSLPDVSIWNNSNIIERNDIFYNCFNTLNFTSENDSSEITFDL